MNRTTLYDTILCLHIYTYISVCVYVYIYIYIHRIYIYIYTRIFCIIIYMYKCIGMDYVSFKLCIYIYMSKNLGLPDFQQSWYEKWLSTWSLSLSLSLSAFSPRFSPYFQTKPICSAPPPRAYWAYQSAPSEAAQVRPGARGKPSASLKPPWFHGWASSNSLGPMMAHG